MKTTRTHILIAAAFVGVVGTKGPRLIGAHVVQDIQPMIDLVRKSK